MEVFLRGIAAALPSTSTSGREADHDAAGACLEQVLQALSGDERRADAAPFEKHAGPPGPPGAAEWAMEWTGRGELDGKVALALSALQLAKAVCGKNAKLK